MQSKNRCKFKNMLLSYYRVAQINDKKRFTEIYKKGIYDNELRKMLILHEPPNQYASICQEYPKSDGICYGRSQKSAS